MAKPVIPEILNQKLTVKERCATLFIAGLISKVGIVRYCAFAENFTPGSFLT